MKNSSQFLFLASGVKNGEGFWFVGFKKSDENILDDKNLLDCHRKELVGYDSAREILFAINLNLNNLLDELKNNKYILDKPPLGISFNIPLEVLENIFDFWIGIYQKREAWETCLGLLKIRKKIPLTNLIRNGTLKGNSRKWAIEIETLHKYEINKVNNKMINKPMWN